MILRSLLTLAIGPLASVSAAEGPLPVFILAGQSNMAGQGLVTELPPELAKPHPEVLVFQGGAWVPLEAGVAPESKQRFGPEVGFGLALAKQLGRPVGLIKHAVGGTNLAKQWSPEDPRSLYAHLATMVTDAKASRPIVLVGMLWMQGEADAKDEAMAAAYGANLAALIAAARTDFAAPDLLFICGRVNPPSGARYAFSEPVRAAQAAVALPGYRMIDCDALTKGGDNLHYDTKGQLDLGRRFAETLAEVLAGKSQ